MILRSGCSPPRLPVRRALPILALACLGVAAGGCYKHVVGARGFGADESMKVHEPNAPDDRKVRTRTRSLPSGRTDTRRGTMP